MSTTRTARRKTGAWVVLTPVLGALLLLALWSESSTPARSQRSAESAPSCDNSTPPMQFDIDCAALPNTIAKGEMVTDSSSPATKVLDYDLFAWNSFVAMNWPAVVPSASNGNRRGFPDLSKSFAGASPEDLTVWETYKEKREIFLANPFSGKNTPDPQPQPWNAAPVYGPADAQVPLCPSASARSGFEQHIAHATKLTSAFDTLDETAEVASEARETNAVLCQGHSPDCGVSGMAVGPRVWRGQPNDGGVPVLYEVKVNWDFYNYLQSFQVVGVNRPLWVQGTARNAAMLGSIRLPARTSAASAPYQPGTGFHQDSVTPTPKHGLNPIVTDYSASACLDQSGATPCPAGSVHLKAAWLPLTVEEARSGKYHVTNNAFYYQDYTPQPGQPGYGQTPAVTKCKQPAQFGLIGLHIIQRLHEQVFDSSNRPVSQAGPIGGTFVFASWEHIGNDAAGFTYANLFPTQFNGVVVTDPKPYPNVRMKGIDAIPLRRVYDVLPTTQAANELVHRQLGCESGETDTSVWCNYRLIGTQYRAADVPTPAPKLLTTLPTSPLPNIESPVGSGQPYYLANLVIESNLGLQQFQGMPPATTPIKHFADAQPPPGGSGPVRAHNNPADPPPISPNMNDFAFNHDLNNLAWRLAPRQSPASGHRTAIHTSGGSFAGRKPGAYNMGGCMGCHGVAQLRGYAFSFVLLGNQGGGVPDTQTEVEIPPAPPATGDG